MIDPRHVPEVDADEVLARFVFSSKHVRRIDNSIKPDAFVPHPHSELSVTRHRQATEAELWSTAHAIGAVRARMLYGRGDVFAAMFVERGLSVLPDPIMGHDRLPDNPNHANVIGWPVDDKGRQRLIALEIAARARFHSAPARDAR